MIVQSKNKIFNHNDQGIMNVIFYKKFKHLDNCWNVLDYGANYKWSIKTNVYERVDKNFDNAKIIHYNGTDKPWKNIKHFYPKCVDLWNFYNEFNTNNYYSFLNSISIKDRLTMAEDFIE